MMLLFRLWLTWCRYCAQPRKRPPSRKALLCCLVGAVGMFSMKIPSFYDATSRTSTTTTGDPSSAATNGSPADLSAAGAWAMIVPAVVADGEDKIPVAQKLLLLQWGGEADNEDNRDSDEDDDEDDDDDYENGPFRVPYKHMLEYDGSFRESPFELRWPNDERPSWTVKVDQRGQSFIKPGNHICFVHIGKTAGSTIGCTLGFQLHCHHDIPRTGGLLPLYVTNMFHTDVNDCADDTPYNLYTLRDPLERIKSAYVYDRIDPERVRNKSKEEQQEKLSTGLYSLYMECNFWTLDDLAEQGLASDGTASETCKYRAQKAVQGIQRYGNHLFFNYQYYVKSTYTSTNSKILAIRSEHAVKDYNSAESFLNQAPTKTVEKFPRNNDTSLKTTKTDADVHLSAKSQQLLCAALCEDIQMYKKLLFNAVNLYQDDFQTSMAELSRSCPIQAQA